MLQEEEEEEQEMEQEEEEQDERREEEEQSCSSSTTLNTNPMMIVVGQKRETPFMLIKQNKARKKGQPPIYSDQTILRAFAGYNNQLACRDCCFNRVSSNPRKLSCSCCSVLCDEDDFMQDNRIFRVAVAEYQIYFSGLTTIDQQSRVIEWIRMSSLLQGPTTRYTAKGRKYPIPFLTPPNFNQEDYDVL
jgi:hypothetical protein